MSNAFPKAPAGIPYITTEQMREVDRAMIDDYNITLLQMMENAGRNLAEVAIHTVLADKPDGKRAIIAAGPGGNGGGALVAARHLHNRGCRVEVLLAADESKLTDAVRHLLGIVRSIGVSIANNPVDLPISGDVIIDGLFGYSLQGNPREPAASVIRQINESETPVISNDIPSGIDATSGEVYDPAVKATATVTIALPKTGLRSSGASRLIGDLYLGDISVPAELYARFLGMSVSALFSEGPVLEIPNSSG
jgi:NAD(P)H-hydrate epimerase